MNPVPKRRWFRFSLRTLFVAVSVAGIACGLAWINHRVNDRQRMLELLAQRGALTGTVVSKTSISKLPWLWASFGAQPIGVIVLPDGALSEGELSELAALFPESSIERRTYWDMPGSEMAR